MSSLVLLALASVGVTWAVAVRVRSRTCLFIGVVSCGMAAATGASVAAAAVWHSTWHPFLDDGPFKGIPRSQPAEGVPAQTFSVHSGLTLEVFDPGPTEPAPTVQVRDRSGRLVWSIYAVADNTVGTRVATLRFRSWRRRLLSRPTVLATVWWTYGEEDSWWYIREDGQLMEYWYSW